MECIHKAREYHGDLHSENIIVESYGLHFQLKILDFFQWQGPKRAVLQDDICDLVRILYDALGGARFYAKQPKQIKAICLGLKRSLILKRFPTVNHLRQHLEALRWD
jgi:tRNA A-37 threonylcarbamoyl transferase component Bud32